jgi:hypothetical protein
LSEIEPSYWRPDAFLALGEAERAAQAKHTKDYCILYPVEPTSPPRCFIRGVLPVTIHGEPEPIGWGLWVELHPREFDRIWQLWNSPTQADEPPLPGWLANTIKRYPDTCGLPAFVHLVGPTTRPTIRLAPNLDHPFAREAAEGVDLPRSLEWRAWHLH